LHLITVVKPQVVIVNKDAEGRIKDALASYDLPVVLIPIDKIDRYMALTLWFY
jgi:hypothetical protein